GDAEIDVDSGTTYQTIFGFGASLTDSAAYTFNKLKTTNAGAYSGLLKSMFDPSPNANSAGMNYIRVPLGASDFSSKGYSYCDKKDESLKSFSIDVTPSYVFTTLKDIQAINGNIKIHLLPWSPPGWMKDTKSMNGGNFVENHTDQMANYLLKSAQAFKSKGFNAYAISIQNEPQNRNPTYPSALYTTSNYAAVAVSLRKLLDANGMQGVKIIGYEHNWDNAGTYATQLVCHNRDAFDGVAFHCYTGSVTNQDTWHSAFPNKELYFTECAGTLASDWWNDIQWYAKHIFIGGLTHWAQSGLMWNFAADPQGGPVLPGANSCEKGCRGVITISSDGKVTLNQEYYAIAHAAKAILPSDSSGQFGKRIKVGVKADSLTVGAYATKASNGTRYSLVVLNAGGNTLKTSIKFQGKSASYSFPVGLTTMSWMT
ncbi:glycoside hydrolase, partial [Fomitiporia mediterranea MF3/22]|uniref:glycoside hydrolase n=1 Tax=Fomitiporia mediterranea (strain MF3/22) TaxID=694068 RepID=UPI00044092D8